MHLLRQSNLVIPIFWMVCCCFYGYCCVTVLSPRSVIAWTMLTTRRWHGSNVVSTKSALHFYLRADETADHWNNNTTGTSSQTSKVGGLSSSAGILGRNNFGDIMSPTVDDADLLFRDGLVTTSTYSLAQMYGIHHPLDRMVVTANGNLQRLVSSYYDAPVTVVVDHCTLIGDSVWDRRVQLQVYGQTFCVADSQVQVHSMHCRHLVESGQVGLGQLFRYLNILPEFVLQQAGPTEEGGFWRSYTLNCSDVSCSITERFCPGMWELKPND